MPVYETDERRSYLRVTVPIHECFRTTRTPVRTRRNRSRDELKDDIVSLLEREGCLPTDRISAMLGYSGTTPAVREAIRQLMDEGAVVYLYPDKPRRTGQRICLVAGKNDNSIQ